MIAPSPSYGPVQVSLADTDDVMVSVTVYDALGRTVQTVAGGGAFELVGESGVYWLEVETRRGKVWGKVLRM